MKHSILVKFFVIFLTAISVAIALAGAAGIVAIEGAGLYVNSLNELQSHEYLSISKSIATSYASLYAAEELGDVPYVLKSTLFQDPAQRSDTHYWHVQLSQDGKILSQFGAQSALENPADVETFTLAPLYPIVSANPPSEKEEAPPDAVTEPDKEKSADFSETPAPEDYLFYRQETSWVNGRLVSYYLYYFEAPEYTVQVSLQEKVLENSSFHILTSLYPYRYACIAILAVGLILFCAGLVYLLWTAGIDKNGSLRPGALNRIPLDIYLLLAAGCEALMLWSFVSLQRWIEIEGPHPGSLSFGFVNLLGITLPIIGFIYAIAAQSKMPGLYWWRHTGLYWCLIRFGRGIRFLCKGIASLFRLLPLIWQWLLISLFTGGGVVAMAFLARNGSILFTALLCFAIGLSLCVVLYGAYCLGLLIKGVNSMSSGNLDYKISTRYLRGSYRELAQSLNALSETARLAAEHETRSERMKSELITNVTHDIKTPLTSIINFVDLLQKPHTPQQAEEYLDVLSRQSTRMKKLIEDLLELSKVSTGNISVNLTRLNAAETVNQALGEFSDKLEAAQITPVFFPPEAPIYIRADGRLVWRILSNLLSNAVKYALPGTRLYVDLVALDDRVLLSLKNISREPNLIHADELLERFVRGDTARNSEGSGLGLNIAKNLMEAQSGQLQLLVDGDLFKVTLIFPGK